MKTVSEYTQDNILVLPQALYGMKDLKALMHHGDAVIFKKQLENDLVDVEFYTNQPCFVYIESGYETLTNSDNVTIKLEPGMAIFLAQGANLHSDFVKATESLTAFLVFFDEQVILNYLKKVNQAKVESTSSQSCVLVDHSNVFTSFFNGIQTSIASPDYLDLKLQELLHLMALQGEETTLHSLLLKKTDSIKRNLHRLLESDDIIHLTVGDLAKLSGRSLSSFNRDFKNIYNDTPKQWLRDKRLKYANDLLEKGTMSVTEVALEIGYENTSNFIKVFKAKYGKTPNQIKRSI